MYTYIYTANFSCYSFKKAACNTEKKAHGGHNAAEHLLTLLYTAYKYFFPNLYSPVCYIKDWTMHIYVTATKRGEVYSRISATLLFLCILHEDFMSQLVRGDVRQ